MRGWADGFWWYSDGGGDAVEPIHANCEPAPDDPAISHAVVSGS
jgi:hypothetical protein